MARHVGSKVRCPTQRIHLVNPEEAIAANWSLFLSVFAGGFTLEAVESVCAGKELERNEVLQLLSHLVDKSLVLVAEHDREARYRLLETIRQYVWEQLLGSGEERQFLDQHAGYYLALAEEAEPELKR